MRWIILFFLIYPSVTVALVTQRLQLTHHRQPPRCSFWPATQHGSQIATTSILSLSQPDSGVEDGDPPKRKNLTWEESYQLLCEYQKTHGNCNVPQSQKPLGTFVNRQRIEYARFMDPQSDKPTAMTSRRKELLDKIGFVWDIIDQTWNTRYKELCEFRKENGHSVVPRSNGPLGAWVEKQRIEYKKYKALIEDGASSAANSVDERPRTTLTKERVQKLNDIGFVYDVREKQFEQNVGALRIFKEIHGHIDPRFMNGKLALWVRKWEQQYRKYLEVVKNYPNSTTILSEILPESRLAALESVGFKPEMFDEPRERVLVNQRVTWDERYKELLSFKEKTGHCMVPKNYGPLGSWVRAQRHARVTLDEEGDRLLSPQRIKLLDKLDFVWDVHSWQWNQTYYELIEYRKEHRNTNVPMSHGALGLWVFNQRAAYNNYRKGKPSQMTAERAELLRSIGFEFYFGKRLKSAADDRWGVRLEELRVYQLKTGHLNVKQSENPSLYNWVQHQKKCYRASLQGKKSPSLKKVREEALQSIGLIENT